MTTPRLPFIPGFVGGMGAVPIAAEEEIVEQQAPPSTYAVAAVVDGDAAAVPRLIGLTTLRAVFIAPGFFAASWAMGSKLTGWQLVGFSLAGSVTISLGMLAWYALKRAGWVT
jgi:hypothetical protein